MRKKFLFGIVGILILITGVVSVQGLMQNQTVQQENTENLAQNMNQQIQVEEVVQNDNVDNASAYSSGDLLYREFSSGVGMESGTDILIEKEQVINALEDVVSVGVILDGEVYKEISLEETDIEFTLEKSGNYVFMAVTADGETADITSIIRAEKTVDGGVILLK